MDHSQERTENPSPRRLREARESGDVPFSHDLFKGLFLLCSLLILWASAKIWSERFFELFQFSYLSTSDPICALKEALLPFLFPMIFTMLLLFAIVPLLYFIQRGFFFAFKKQKIAANQAKLPPALFFFLKTATLLLLAFFFLRYLPHTVLTLLYFLLSIGLALTFLGLIDFLYQRYRWKQRMKMTLREVKDEQKESQGNR